jgi:hypothetical protein
LLLLLIRHVLAVVLLARVRISLAVMRLVVALLLLTISPGTPLRAMPIAAVLVGVVSSTRLRNHIACTSAMKMKMRIAYREAYRRLKVHHRGKASTLGEASGSE